MKLSIASDHAAYDLKQQIKDYLEKNGHAVTDFGTGSEKSVDYPDFAVPAAKEVADGNVDCGIVICGSGIGMSIVCNKIKGIRSANCITVEMAELARLHNNANVLNMGARLVNIETAKKIVDAFLTTKFEGGRHVRRVDKIHSLTGK